MCSFLPNCNNKDAKAHQTQPKIDFGKIELDFSEINLILPTSKILLECSKFLGGRNVISTETDLINKDYKKNLFFYNVRAFTSNDTMQLALVYNSQAKLGLFFNLTNVGIMDCGLHGIYLYGIQSGDIYGYFKMYQIFSTNVVESFNSELLCGGKGVVVKNSSIDCKSYSPFFLNLEIDDVNKDGFDDFIFLGNVLYYCEGLERGYGRLDRKPIKKEPIEIQFLSQILDNSKLVQWNLMDSMVCMMLHEE